jgi:hypothetical protein
MGDPKAVEVLERYMAERYDAGTTFSDEADTDPDLEAAALQARDYATRRNARNASERPLRTPSDDSESAQDGYQSAVSWLERRRKSAIRK